jgi:UDP-N-acetylmuramoyl-tripeptide--D-alanyl-D-alanine ligase
MKLTLLEILEATAGGELGGTMVGNTYSSFHTDSREVVPGGVFFALRGAEMDGHKFVQDAITRGAAAVVVERRSEVMTGVAEILVPDAWAALYGVAAYTLDRVRPLVVGVTGSNGKTSTKEMVAAILSTGYRVLSTQGNLNTETGVPMTILDLEPHHDALVLEMGMQKAGDIGRLAALAHPRIGIVTNVGTVHMEFFATREELARAKGELVASLPEDGLAVLNADNEFYPQLARMTSAGIASFGAEHGEYRVEDYRLSNGGGSRFAVRGVDVRLAMSGRHQALNAAAALAAGEGAGVTLAAGAAALGLVTVEHRLQEIAIGGGYSIVDDAYNASPESMVAAFEALIERPRRGRLLAVLGAMGELGSGAEEAHRDVGRRAAAVFDSICVVASPLGRVMADSSGAQVVLDQQAAAEWVRRNARERDRVLIKGSHAARLDQVVEALTSS